MHIRAWTEIWLIAGIPQNIAKASILTKVSTLVFGMLVGIFLKKSNKQQNYNGSTLQTLRAVINIVYPTNKEQFDLGNEIFNHSNTLYQNQISSRDKEISQIRSIQIGGIFLALLFGILAAVIIAKPIRETLDIIERIAASDLTQNLVFTRRDELGLLQQGIQRTGQTLSDLISGVRDGVTEIASAAEELSTATEQSSVGVNSQKSETDQVAPAIHGMTTIMQEVARNAERASLAATEKNNVALEGNKVVAEAMAQSEHLAAEVVHSTEAMTLLQRESNKTGSVMDAIKAVDEQKNLLTLNATMEAARAGEASRWLLTKSAA